jgi:hypothetical protein
MAASAAPTRRRGGRAAAGRQAALGPGQLDDSSAWNDVLDSKAHTVTLAWHTHAHKRSTTCARQSMGPLCGAYQPDSHVGFGGRVGERGVVDPNDVRKPIDDGVGDGNLRGMTHGCCVHAQTTLISDRFYYSTTPD